MATLATLTVPLNIWLSATRGERDQMFVDAGFDPALDTVDNGTDVNTVRFAQFSRPGAAVATGAQTASQVVNNPPPMAAGDDTRDFQPSSLLTGDNPVTDEFGIAAPVQASVAVGALSIAGRALKIIMGGGGGRIVASTWAALPSFARSLFIQLGIGVGSLIAFNGDIPFITLPGQDTTPEVFIGPQLPPVDIQVGGPMPMMGVQIVGSWNTNPKDPANGVTFFRLSDGKLAVQNKKGRWKVWRPKKPIVLFANGASDLKTMLRADKALNKQAKSIASFLNRRSGTKKTTKKTTRPIIIQQGSGKIIDAY